MIPSTAPRCPCMGARLFGSTFSSIEKPPEMGFTFSSLNQVPGMTQSAQGNTEASKKADFAIFVSTPDVLVCEITEAFMRCSSTGLRRKNRGSSAESHDENHLTRNGDRATNSYSTPVFE